MLHDPADAIELTLDYGMSTVFELDVDTALALVPKRLCPVEVRPNVALASLIFFRFAPDGLHGTFGALPAYGELVFGVHVAPVLAWTPPKFAVHVVQIGCTHPRASEFLSQVHRMPAHPSVVRVEVDEALGQVVASDAGGPIATMRSLRAAPICVPTTLTAHVFSESEGGVWGYPEIVEGRMCRHQDRGQAVTLHPHPFFKGARLPPSPPAWMQTVGLPGETLRQLAWLPVEVSARAS
ncbi:MAG: hypothetical protein IT371_18550 [Deltaproteobacteria bacterium]|nr:hypothetical protein [Deltaproteobacteria bacterium]